MILSGGQDGEDVTWSQLCCGKYGNIVYNESELVEIDCRKTNYKVITGMSRKEIIRSWTMVQIGIDTRDITQLQLIGQRNSTIKMENQVFISIIIWQVFLVYFMVLKVLWISGKLSSWCKWTWF